MEMNKFLSVHRNLSECTLDEVIVKHNWTVCYTAILKESPISIIFPISFHLKGTVSRDFLLQVFS